MQLRLKGEADIGCAAAETDEDSAGRDPVDMEALGLEPAADGGNVLVGEAESLPDLGGVSQ
jgi:hypothetical protein